MDEHNLTQWRFYAFKTRNEINDNPGSVAAAGLLPRIGKRQ
jgi:hypothetical protein